MLKRILPQRFLDMDAYRICLIKPSSLGDVVQSLPLLPVLCKRFPNARISWVINREFATLLERHPHLDDIIPFDRRGSWISWFRLRNELRRRRFDLAIDLQGLLRTGLMTAATNAAVRIGLETAREGAHLACHYTIPNTGRQVPAHQRYRRVAQAFGVDDVPLQTLIATSRKDREWTELQLAKLRRPVLAIHPGARWITKRWPVQKFADVANNAIRSYGASVVLIGSQS